MRSISISCLMLCLIGGCQKALPEGGIQASTAKAALPMPSPKNLFAGYRCVDLTHPLDASTIFWPGGEGFKFTKKVAGVTERGYYYTANEFSTAEHGGTHLDAPIHFFKDRETVDQIPLERLMGEAVIVDVREQCAANRDYQIGVADLREWEEKHGRQLVEVIVLLRTGYAAHWPDRELYLGTNEMGAEAVKELHFPGLDPAAAKWLAEERSIKAIGIDTASIDYGQSKLFGSHVMFCEHNIPALENVKLVNELPEGGFSLIALPIKIGGGSGGPTRIVALLKE